MKKIITVILCLIFIVSAFAIHASAIGESFSAASGTPAVDGIADGIWSMSSRQKFKYSVDGDLNDGKAPGSCSGFVTALWDENALYFLLEISDNDFMFGGEGEFSNDEVCIYIDEADRFGETWQDGQVCLRIIPDENGSVEVTGDIGEGSQVAVSVESESKRFIEVKYVPTVFKIEQGAKLLVDFRFNDVYQDNGENKLAFALTWSDELNEGGIDSSNWSYLKIGGGAVSGEGTTTAEEAAQSIGQPLITEYEYVSGSGTYGYDGEKARNMFDGDVGTKFCTPEMPASAIMKLDRKFIITGVIMATANDTASYSDRNPDDWVLEGSPDQQKWTVIAKGDSSFLEATNYTYYAQKIESDGKGYRFIRFTNKRCGGDIMQLSELMVCGIKSSASKEEINALLNPAEVVPVPSEDAIYLPISAVKSSYASSVEAIAAPVVPGSENGVNSDIAVTVVVVSASVILIGVCGVIALLQSKQKRGNIL